MIVIIKNSVSKKAMTWDEWYTECDAVPHQTFVTIRKETENEPEPEVSVKKIKLRITSDLDPSDESHDDPPYQGVPPERPAAPPPRCDIRTSSADSSAARDVVQDQGAL